MCPENAEASCLIYSLIFQMSFERSINEQLNACIHCFMLNSHRKLLHLLQYFLPFAAKGINESIEDAILTADKIGVKVISLAALNKVSVAYSQAHRLHIFLLTPTKYDCLSKKGMNHLRRGPYDYPIHVTSIICRMNL